MLYDFSILIQICVGFLPIVFVIYSSDLKKHGFILSLLIISFLSDLLNSISDLNAEIIWNSYNFFEFTLLALIHNKYNNSFWYKLLLIVSSVIFSIQYAVEFNILNTMNKSLSLSVIFYIIWSLVGSMFYLKNTQAYKSENSEYLYFNAAMLIYFSSSLIFFNIIPFLTCNDGNIWIIHNVVESISKLIIAYAFWKLPSRSIS